jgi:polar amino acid transport system substrate-binding protein
VELLATDAVKTESYLTEAGSVGDGTVVACGCVDVTTSSRLDAQRFVNAFQFDIGASPGPYAVEGWDAGAAFVNAVRAGALTRQEVSAGLEGLTRYQGLAGAYAFTRAGELAASSAAIRFYRAEGGRWIALGSEDGARPFSLHEDGVLTVATCRWGQPFADRRGGTTAGFDVAVAKRLAAGMGLRLSWRRLGCAREAAALASGRIDALADVGRPGPRGSELTRIYLSLRQALVAARRSGIHGVGDLRPGDLLAVVRGSAADDWGRRELRDRGVGLRRVAIPDRALRLVRRRRVDATLVDASLLPPRDVGRGARIVAPDVDVGDYRVFAVSRDNPGLLAALDGEIAQLVRSGAYRRAHRRWFPGTTIPDEVGST